MLFESPIGYLETRAKRRSKMHYTQAGIILFTQNYDACVEFYQNTLSLAILHRIDRSGERLTTFDLGGTYLMIETGGIAFDTPKTMDRSPIKFRFNVPDVAATCAALRDKGIAVDLFQHSWGTTAEFHDPDGNCCALRSNEGFGL